MSSRATEQATEMALRAETTVFAVSISKGGFFGVGDKSKETRF